MTSKEFVLWLKGFTEGVHEFNITPKQWDLLKDKLAEVTDEKRIGTTIGEGGFGTPNTHPFPTWQQPHIINPHYIGDIPQVNLPFISTTPNGTGGNPTPPTFTITTTPGSGSISVGSSGFGGLTTSTTRWNPSGSAWSYTNAGYNPPYTTGGEDEIKKYHNED